MPRVDRPSRPRKKLGPSQPLSVAVSAEGSRGLTAFRAWFAAQGWEPFEFQESTWRRYLAGESGLVNVPTGAGKTYAAYGGPLIELIDELPPDALCAPLAKPRARARRSAGLGLRVLYLTPLRAVSRDIELALARPVRDLGIPIRVESRTGDTSTARRARQKEAPPEVLVTTPESLSLLLTADDGGAAFAGLRAVILDEWHELLASKRGTQTELALARLRRVAPRLRTWALSATLRNLDEAASAAVGVTPVGAPPPTIVRAPLERPVTLETVIPERRGNLPWAGHMGLRMLPELLRVLDPSVSTLIFTNTRAQAELWHQALAFSRPEWSEILALHHGSIERADRERVEAGVKSGSIRLVVCTSSLDLGVDFAPVERVVQIGSPKGIARLLQRAGRSGHRPGAASHIICVPTHQMELVEVAAVRRALDLGDIEPRLPIPKPLDVLAQHVVTRALGGGFDPDELFDEVRQAWSYRDLTRQEFDWAVALCRDGGGTFKRYPEFNKIALAPASGAAREGDPLGGPSSPRYRVTTPRIAQLHRMNLGTITMTSGVVDLRYASGRRIGSIDESFIAFVDVGERFYFAGKTLQLVRLEPSEAIVKPARGRTSRTPHWSGIRLPISESLAAEIRATVGERAAGMKTPTTGTAELRAAEHFFEIQEANSRIPTSDQTLVELAATRDGFHCFMFPFEGRSVHGGLAALLALRLARRIPATFTTAVNDYGFEILCPSEFPFEAELTGDRGRELFSLDHLAEDARESVNISALAKLQFREIARVSGLVFQTYPGGGGRKSGRQMSASSSLIYEVLEQFDPQNLLLEQARREVLDKQFESSRLARTLSRLAKSELLFVRTERPTPLSFPLMIERVGAKLSTESISDRIARMQEAWEESAS